VTTADDVDTWIVSSTPSLTADAAASQGRDQASAERSGARKGERIDRYLVLDHLGAGGMGEVLVAYDPQLDRRVALKLLRPDSHAEDPQASTRMLREAQALAKLSHPNVVAVHDVGTHHSQVYIAMEYVEGTSLSVWLRTPRPWREATSMLIASGRGLAAAHAAGIVHRDFKPGNVMIGRDGRARVLDFGLARATLGSDTPDPWSRSSSGRRSSPDLASELTEAGAVMGTPAYMAPEQFLGKPVGPAADQFAFCVTLHAALYGKRPFSGSTYEALARAHTTGRIEDPPRNTHVPKRLRAIVLRGLSVSPTDRWPSMDALLDQLERATRPIGRKLLVGVLAASTLSAGAWALHAAEQTPCKGAHDRLKGVWDVERRQAVEQAFIAVDTPYAADSLDLTAARIDAWVDEWIDAYTDTCEATHVRGEQSTELLDLRMTCLRHQLEDLDALVDVFSNADASVAEHAVQAANRLPPVQRCANTETLTGALRPPEDEAERTAVDTLRRRFAPIRALALAGKHEEALEGTEMLLQEAEETGDLPLVAEIAVEHAMNLERFLRKDEAREVALRGLDAAARSGHVLYEARALTVLLGVLGATAFERGEITRLATHADALLECAGSPSEHVARLRLMHGTVLMRKGEYDEALERMHAVVEHTEGRPELTYILLAAMNNIAAAHAMRGELAEALERFEVVIELTERHLGAHHPARAMALMNAANSSFEVGDLEVSWTYSEHALALWRATSETHPEITKGLTIQARIIDARGDLEGALALTERVVELKRSELGERDHSLAYSLNNLGDILMRMGRLEAAIPHLEEAHAILVNAFTEEHPGLCVMLMNLGYVHLELDRIDEAIDLLERARRIRVEHGLATPEHFDADFWLARALWIEGSDRARALELARHALEGYPEGEVYVQRRENVRAWLAERGG
jgi:eukaryotic-like serine/threonine-protein kinase